MPIYGMDPIRKYVYEATLIHVVDGDTVDAWIDLGFNISVRRRIRLWGICAPEMCMKTVVRLQDLIDQGGGAFILRSIGLDKHGRCLGEIYIQDVNINRQLLAEGMADVYKG
tara:strand:+ start:100 stop:435 length:336 start_codon:yes stop_codon:yes gene_type:complete